LEFDLVREEGDGAVVSEVKFKNLSAIAKRQLEYDLSARWQRCALQNRYKEVRFEMLDASLLN
jgi:hypothetical protein